jgi:hypothetical protein
MLRRLPLATSELHILFRSCQQQHLDLMHFPWRLQTVVSLSSINRESVFKWVYRTSGNGMMDRASNLFKHLEDLCICLYRRSRKKFRANSDATHFSNVSSNFETLNGNFLISRGKEPIGTDQRRIIRISRINGDIATRKRGCNRDCEGCIIETIIHWHVRSTKRQ